MQLTVLGYYGGYPYAGVGTSSYLLTSGAYHLLLDCGSGALLALEKQFDPLQLDVVLLTHYHHDHIADVGVLQYYWQLHQGTKKEPILPIYGHLQDPLHFGSLTQPGVTQGFGYQEDTELTLGPLKVTFKRTVHPVPAFAVRIEEQTTGQVLVFTADTAYFPELAAFCQSADLLMTDTNFLEDRTGKMAHMTTTQSGNLAQESGAAKILLTHLPQGVSAETLQAQAQATVGDVPVIVAQQNLTIDVGACNIGGVDEAYKK